MERCTYLLEAAHCLANTSSQYACSIGLQFYELTQHYRMDVDDRIRRRLCGFCGALMTSSRIRINKHLPLNVRRRWRRSRSQRKNGQSSTVVQQHLHQLKQSQRRRKVSNYLIITCGMCDRNQIWEGSRSLRQRLESKRVEHNEKERIQRTKRDRLLNQARSSRVDPLLLKPKLPSLFYELQCQDQNERAQQRVLIRSTALDRDNNHNIDKDIDDTEDDAAALATETTVPSSLYSMLQRFGKRM